MTGSPQPDARLTQANKMHRATNAFHGFIYFAPQATARYNDVGLEPDQHYFASRAAPMGPVPAETVLATFFNFAPRRVRAAIPSAWEAATPADIQEARLRAVNDCLEAALTTLSDPMPADDIDQAVNLCRRVVDALDWSGRPLAGANAAVREPDDALLALWQLVAVTREWRGDAHVAALSAAGLGGIDALVVHAATGEVPRSALQQSRGWTDDEWEAAVADLTDRGWCQADGSFTDTGRAARAEIERTTDDLSARMWAPLDDSETDSLRRALRPITKGLWANMPLPDWTKS